MYCKKWWPVPPECLELAHGTRVCIVRADTAGEMVRAVLPTLMEHVPGFQHDLMVYNTGWVGPLKLGRGGESGTTTLKGRAVGCLSCC
jgi:hypothetical protein